MTDDAVVDRITAKLMERDEVTKGLDLEILGAGTGRAVMAMTVATKHLNAHGICHGGMIATLADTALALASNSYNLVTLTQHCSFDYVAQAQLGDRLIATAEEASRQGRTGVYDITVRRADGTVVALARGLTRATKATHF